MAVPEDDQVGVGESTVQACGPALRGAAVMDEGDADPFELEEAGSPEAMPDQVMVVVAEHGIGLRHGLQLHERLP